MVMLFTVQVVLFMVLLYAIFSSGADTEEFFYRLGLKDGLNLKNTVKLVLEMIS